MCLEGETVRGKSASAYSIQEADRRGVWLLPWPAPANHPFGLLALGGSVWVESIFCSLDLPWEEGLAFL